MKSRILFSSFLIFLIFLGPIHKTWAQAGTSDSARLVQKQLLEAQRIERQRALDSTKAARKIIADSLAQLRKYRESKRFKDSVEDFRARRLDSIKTARTRITDSITAERKRVLDSSIAVRQRINDSLKAIRDSRLDSLNEIREYRSSKHFKDSVAEVRQKRLDSIQSVRRAFNDSVTKARNHILDSTKAERKKVTDSIRLVREARLDSLQKIRKYRESKRYKDSVQIVRQNRLDSIRIVRQRINDSMRAERKKVADSIMAVRKSFNDSLSAARQVRMDSINALRKVRADSMAKKAEEREAQAKERQRLREEKSNLKFELKLAKKREAWSNEKMLKKKWSVPRQVLQNTFTRYNYYFNAELKMQEAERNMRRSNLDNYDSLLSLFPFNPDRDSSKMIADMDSIIQKTSIGLQIHDPRTKWADDLYLLLGQAYFYKGDYANAQAAFRYVISIRQQRIAAELKKNAGKYSREERASKMSLVEDDDRNLFDVFKHQSVHNEAILWLTRVMSQQYKFNDAEAILDLVEVDKNTDEQLLARISLEKAFMQLRKGEEASALPYLDSVVDEQTFPNWLRQRAAFLAGQLHDKEGKYERSAEMYHEVVDLHPSPEMDFYARKNAAYALLRSGGDADNAIASMKKLLNDGKYLKYNDQIYFVLGRLSATQNNNQQAVEYFNNSISDPKATRRQKAITYAALGDLHFEMGNYTSSKMALDSASFYSKHAADQEEVQLALKRAAVVDNIALPAEQIHNADSLLALSALSEKEKEAVVKKQLREMRRELEAKQFAANNPSPIDDLMSAGANSSRDWYFSSTKTLQQGSNDFKRRYGNRPLVDNWRRNSAINNLVRNNSAQDDDEESLSGVDKDGLPTEAALLAAIPSTVQQKEDLHLAIRRAYVDMSAAYINDLEEYYKGLEKLSELEQRYPEHEHKAEVSYLRYTAFMQTNDYEKAQQYAQQLSNQFPESRFAQLVKPTEVATPNVNIVPVQTYYQLTYDQVNNRVYDTALTRVRAAYSMYLQKDYQKKFKIIEGIALAGLERYKEADTLMQQFIAQNSGDSLITWATSVRNFIQLKQKEDSLLQASLKRASTTADSLKTADSLAPPAAFIYNAQQKHWVIIGFTQVDPKVIAFQAGLGDYNKLAHSASNLTTDYELLQPTEVFIIVKAFANAQQAKGYEASLRRQHNILFRDFDKKEYTTFVISEDNYRLLQARKDIQAYQKFYQRNYR